MSTTIDNKVVSMEFQNDRFEKNIAQTQTSLERLKKSLKFNGASKGFEELQKSADKVNLNTIANSIDNINSKFNVMTYAAASAVANVTDRFVNMGINLGKSLSIDQLTAGWEKYNEKTANVQTIMNATGKSVEEVNDILGELQWFSDETSYSFTQMTKAFADMTSKGGEADKVKDMVMGIAEATAFAGKTGNEFSRVIYNLSQAYGSKLLVKDWMSIENAGVNSEQLIKTLIAAGEKAGTIKKGAITVATFRDSLRDGWVTSTVMEDAFSGWYAMMKEANRLVNDEHAFDTAAEAIASLEGKYDDYVEKATKAAQTAKSFNEAIDATKDAVSSQWSRIWESIFGNYEQASELWTEVVEGMWTAFAEPISNTADQIEEVMSLGSSYADFSAKLEKAGISGENFRSELVKIGVELGTLDKETAETTENINDLFTKEKGVWLTDNVIVTTLKRFQGTMDGVGDATKSVAMTFEELESVAKRVIQGEFGAGTERIKKLEEAGYKAATVQSLVNKMMYKQAINAEDYADALKEMSSSQLESINLTEEQRNELAKLIEETGSVEEGFKKLAESMTKPSGRELLIDSFRIMIQSTMRIVEQFKESYRTFFPKKTTSELYTIIEKFHEFAESISISDKNLKKLRRSFDGLFAAIDIVLRLASIPFNFAMKVLNVVLSKLGMTTLDLVANIGDAIVAFRDWLFETGPLADALNDTATFVGNIIAKVITLWGEFKELPMVQKTVELFGKAWEKIVKIFEDLKKRVEKFRGSLKELKDNEALTIPKIWEAFKKDIFNDFEDINQWFDEFKKSGEKVGSAFSSAFDSARIKTGGFLAKLKEFGSSMLDAIFGGENGEPWGAAEVVAILSGVAVAKLTSAFSNAIRSFDGLAGAATGVLNSISGAFKNLAGIFKSFKYQVWTMGLLNIAKAVLFLAGAVWILAKIPQADLDKAVKGLWNIVGMFSALAIVMTGLSIAMNKWGAGGSLKVGSKISGKSGGFFALAFTVTALAVSMLALAGALKIISTINPDQLFTYALTLSLLMAALGAIATIVNMYAPSMANGAVTILAMGLAIKAVVKAMLKLQELLTDKTVNWTAMYSTILIIGGIMVLLTKVLGSVGDWKAGIAVVGIALAFKLIVSTLKDIGELDATAIRNNTDILVAAIFSLVAVMAATRLLGANVAKAGAAVTGIVGSLILLTLAIKMTQDMKPEQAWHTLKVLEPLIIAMAGVLAASYLTGKYAARAGALIAATGFAMILISVAIKTLANIPEADIKKATNNILKIEALFALLILVTGDYEIGKFKMNHNAKAGPFIAIGIIMAILTLLIVLMAKSKNLDKINSAIKSLSIMIVSLGLLMVGLSKLGDIKIKFSSLIALTTIMALMAGVIAALTWLINGDINASQLLAVSASVAILTAVMVGITLALKKFGEIRVSTKWQVALKRLLPAMIVLGAIMAAIAGMSHLVNTSMSPAQMLAMTASVAVLATVVTGMSMALFKISKSKAKINFGSLLSTILPSLAVVGAIMAGVVILSNQFNTSMSPSTLLGLSASIAILAVVIVGIGTAITLLGKVGGSAAAGAQGLVVLLEAIAGLAVIIAAMVGINEALKALYKTDIIAETEQLAVVMTNIGSAIGGFIGGLVGTAINEFVDGLLGIGDSLKSFGQNLKDSGLTLDSAKLILALSGAFVALAGSGFAKVLSEIADKLTLGNFKITADDFKNLGEMISTFNKATAGISSTRSETLTVITKSVTDIANAFKTLSEAGGVDLADFTDNITYLGNGLVEFGNVSADLNTDGVQKGVDAGNLISNFQKSLYGEGGLVQLIAGEKNLSDFAQNMRDLAEGLVDFATTSAGVDQAAVQNGVDMANKIADINVDSIGGVVSWFTGKSDIGTFGKKLKKFAKGLGKFIDAMIEYEPSDFDKANQAVDLANALSKIDLDLSKLDTSIGSKTAELFEGLTEKINSYCLDILDVIQDYSSKMESAGSNFMSSLFKGIENASDSKGLATFTQGIVDNIANVARDLSGSITSGFNIGLAGLNLSGLNGNINMSMMGSSSMVFNARVVGTVKVDFSEVVNALNGIKDMAAKQYDALLRINQSINASGKVYLDGNVIAGYVNKKLGTSSGPVIVSDTTKKSNPPLNPYYNFRTGG